MFRVRPHITDSITCGFSMATDKIQKYKKTISSSPDRLQSAKKATASKATPLVSDPGRLPGMHSTNDGFSFLSSALHATFFFDYFEHIANKSYSGGRSDIKILKLKAVHPHFHQCAIKADFCGRIVVYALLVIFATFLVGSTVWKTIIK